MKQFKNVIYIHWQYWFKFCKTTSSRLFWIRKNENLNKVLWDFGSKLNKVFWYYSIPGVVQANKLIWRQTGRPNLTLKIIDRIRSCAHKRLKQTFQSSDLLILKLNYIAHLSVCINESFLFSFTLLYFFSKTNKNAYHNIWTEH